MALTGAFLWQMLAVTNREVITNDEGFHTYAGYRYWQCADFGVNPEHPPLAKMVAGLVLQIVKIPAPSGACPVVSTAKGSGYADSAEWLYGSTGPGAEANIDRVIPLARRGMATFALLLALTAFFFTRRMFGDLSALVSLALIAFEPTLVAHGSLVTTDMALSAMSLLAVASFFLFHRRRTFQRLLLAGLSCGLALSVKHSGILIVPTLLLLAIAELGFDWNRGQQSRTSKVLKEAAAVLFILFLGLGVLWATYHFRYAARPDGTQMTTSLRDFMADTQAKENHSVILKTIPFLAYHHLLPEAYLYGFVDVLSISDPGQSAFLFGHLYPHGVPQYFPSVILIKTTLGMIGLALLPLLASRKHGAFCCKTFLLFGSHLSVATCGHGQHAEHRISPHPPSHLLVVSTVGRSFTQRTNGRFVRSSIEILLLAHAASSLAAFPNELAYGNEIFGGISNSHNLLTDSNNDWGQALPQVAKWLKDNRVTDCSFAYDLASQRLNQARYRV